jgi:hypothetical protein
LRRRGRPDNIVNVAVTDEHPSRIALRIIVDGAAAIAEAAWAQVQVALARCANIRDVTIKPYWKFEGSHELAITLEPGGSPDAAYDAIARSLASGWAEHADGEFAQWAVWNRGNGEFIDPTVCWAHLELIRR